MVLTSGLEPWMVWLSSSSSVEELLSNNLLGSSGCSCGFREIQSGFSSVCTVSGWSVWSWSSVSPPYSHMPKVSSSITAALTVRSEYADVPSTRHYLRLNTPGPWTENTSTRQRLDSTVRRDHEPPWHFTRLWSSHLSVFLLSYFHEQLILYSPVLPLTRLTV